MTKTNPTISDLEARLAAGGTVTPTEWAKAKASDSLAEAEAAANEEIEKRRAELERETKIEALLARTDEPWDSAQAVLDARQETQVAIAKLADAVKTLKNEWDVHARTLRALNPGHNVIVAAGERWSIHTPNKTINGFDKHTLAQLVAELTMSHYEWTNQPTQLRALMGRQPHYRIQALERLAGTAERNVADWQDANPGEDVPDLLIAAQEAA